LYAVDNLYLSLSCQAPFVEIFRKSLAQKEKKFFADILGGISIAWE